MKRRTVTLIYVGGPLDGGVDEIHRSAFDVGRIVELETAPPIARHVYRSLIEFGGRVKQLRLHHVGRRGTMVGVHERSAD